MLPEAIESQPKNAVIGHGIILSVPIERSNHGYPEEAAAALFELPAGVWYPSPLGSNGAWKSTHWSVGSSEDANADILDLPTITAPRSMSFWANSAVSVSSSYVASYGLLDWVDLIPARRKLSLILIRFPASGCFSFGQKYSLLGTTMLFLHMPWGWRKGTGKTLVT